MLSLRHIVVLVGVLTVMPAASPRAAQQHPPSNSPDDQPIFRLSVDLVQLDAVVTDGKGRHVTTLGPDDFEIFQDGRPQPVIAATYVESDDGWIDASGLPPVAPAALRPADARRVIAMVVDDLRMSFSSMYYARRGLGQFLDEQFRPGDLAMLLTTAGPSGSVRLTFSPATLKAAVNRLRYTMWDTWLGSALDPVNDTFRGFDRTDSFIEGTFATSAIDRIRQTIEALTPLPGRKSVVLVSEGFSVYGPGMDNARIRDALRELVDRSNRAGVVIYAVDPRGLVYTGLTAADSTGGMRPDQIATTSQARAYALGSSQDGLRYIAGETGGFAVVNTNDLAYGFKRIMADQRGYYLIGYQPEPGTVTPTTYSQFRKVKIKVVRKGLKVRTRAGFYGRTTE